MDSARLLRRTTQHRLSVIPESAEVNEALADAARYRALDLPSSTRPIRLPKPSLPSWLTSFVSLGPRAHAVPLRAIPRDPRSTSAHRTRARNAPRQALPRAPDRHGHAHGHRWSYWQRRCARESRLPREAQRPPSSSSPRFAPIVFAIRENTARASGGRHRYACEHTKSRGRSRVGARLDDNESGFRARSGGRRVLPGRAGGRATVDDRAAGVPSHQELLARFLPAPPARVLDVGGGGGIHSIPLLKQGYHVALIDPMPLHVQQAKVSPRDPPVPSTGAQNRGFGRISAHMTFSGRCSRTVGLDKRAVVRRSWS